MPWLKTLATLKRCLDASPAFLTPLSSRSSNKSDSISCKEPPRSWRSWRSNAVLGDVRCDTHGSMMIMMCKHQDSTEKCVGPVWKMRFPSKQTSVRGSEIILALWNLWNNPSFPCRLPCHGNTPSHWNSWVSFFNVCWKSLAFEVPNVEDASKCFKLQSISSTMKCAGWCHPLPP